MKTIPPALFLEQIELGAELVPHDSDSTVGALVGRFAVECDLRQMNLVEQGQFLAMYREGRIKFGYPGDFVQMPFFFPSRAPRTRREIMMAGIMRSQDLATLPEGASLEWERMTEPEEARV